ncbi:ribonuclease HI family protein [Salimicrobium sp. PL1-032A]|uniref:ribonuclease HI family protein n=1 Tax=Salimicrobium sp. PL1-032A TaxID=3095364 RepID=UPI0032600199
MIEVYTDAATKGDPGPSYAGVFIKNGTARYSYSAYMGELSNHEGEFASACYALKICKDLYPGEIISLRTDSKIVVDTFEMNTSKNKRFLPYLTELQQLSDYFSFVFMKWIPKKENRHADDLSKAALRQHVYKSDTD